MPLKLHGTIIQESNQNLKLALSILSENTSCKDPDNYVVSSEYAVGHLVLVRFKFIAIISYKLGVSASFKIHNLHNDSKTQINVTCYVNDKAQRWICPFMWSEFIDMGYISCVGYIDSSQMYSATINIIVNTSIPSPWTSLYDDDSFTDFHLTLENGSVPVHRVVMAAHSEVFKTMLSGEWKETAKGCLKVKGIIQQTLQHLKDYMYLGTLPEHEDLKPLLLIAKCYMMHHLEKACTDKLAQTVTPEHFQGILEFAVDNRLFALISSLFKNTSAAVVEASEAINKELELKADEE